jgi:MFS family permease
VTELFRNRRFMIFWLGQAVSVVGTGMAPVAFAALVLPHYGITGLGLVMATTSLVYGLALLGGGVIADRYSRTAVMATADVLRCGGALANLALLGRVPLWTVCVLAAVTGLGDALFQPAYRAAFAQLLGPDLLRRANALQGTVNRGGLMLGAALAGVLVATVGARIAFAVDAATFVVSIVTLLVLRLPRVDRAGETSAGLRGAVRDAADGLRAVWRVPWAAVVMAQGTIQVVAGFAPVFVLLPAVATQRYGAGAFGLLSALMGLGSIVGGLIAFRLRPRREGVTAMHAVALFGLVCLCLAVPVPLWVFGAAQVLAWAGIAVFTALWFASLQRHFPEAVQGRVFALEALITFALEPIGFALTPVLAAGVGLAVVGVAAAVVIVSTSYAVLAVKGVPTLGAPAANRARGEQVERMPAAA